MAPPPPKRRRVDGGNYPLLATSNDGVLPADLLHDILLRLPARPACRLRAVCRPWRAMLSDPRFAAAHTARHPDPHLVVAACDRFDAGGIELVDVYLVDVSGDVAKRVPAGRCDPDEVSSTRDGVALLVGNDRRLRVLDAASSAGTVSLVPDDEHHPINCSFTLGRAASSGEHKVLRICTVVQGERQVCAVLTLAAAGRQIARWRDAPSPPYAVRTRRGDVAVAGGVAYFLLRHASYGADWLAAFDLAAEQWRPDLVDGPPPAAWRPIPDRPRVTLAELRGALVVAYDDHRAAALDMWFLLAGDGEQQQQHWSKQYTVTMPYHRRPWRWDGGESAEPVVVLDDGRIVFWVWAGGGSRRGGGVMRVYDPITGGHTDVATAARCAHVGVYTGNLMSLVK
uniref:F-box domain-containing protein n=1 Tax=Oryza punctata TaxID=4537 RepID=A0A0E0LIE0_ORYPU